MSFEEKSRTPALLWSPGEVDLQDLHGVHVLMELPLILRFILFSFPRWVREFVEPPNDGAVQLIAFLENIQKQWRKGKKAEVARKMQVMVGPRPMVE